MHIVPKIRPSVQVASAFNMGAPDTIYQQTTALNDVSYAWDFLLWDRRGVPTARLTVQFTAGSASGQYATTVKINGGNALKMLVDVLRPGSARERWSTRQGAPPRASVRRTAPNQLESPTRKSLERRMQ